MILEVIVSSGTVLLTVTLLALKWSFRYWKTRNVYTPEPTLPFGNVQNVILAKENLGSAVTRVYREARAKGLRYAGLHVVFSPAFVPVDNNLLRHILITDFQHFTDHNPSINEKRDPLIAHLFFLKGAKWKALRTKLTPLFTSGKLKMMFQTLVDCTKDFPDVLDETIKRNEPFDIKEIFARYTTDVIGSVAFGIDCNCLKNPDTEFREFGKQVFKVSFKGNVARLLNNTNPSLLNLFNIKLMEQDIEDFFINIVKETIDHRDKNNYERKDFMQLLMSLRNQEIKLDASNNKNGPSNGHVAYYQNGLTLADITAQAFVFFIAGYETSSTTLNFLMFELVQNLDIQEKLREEVRTALKAHGDKITYEAIQEMTYMDKIVNETLRKYPPLPSIPRYCTKDYKVPNSDLTIVKGTPVFIPVYGVHHDPEYYPDPEKFDPERFSEENKNKRPPATFLPFGEGPRLCIGLRLGVLQTKVGLTALLRDYKFTMSSKTKLPLKFAPKQIILTVDGGVWINAEKI